jgi:hypothetical protein
MESPVSAFFAAVAAFFARFAVAEVAREFEVQFEVVAV